MALLDFNQADRLALQATILDQPLGKRGRVPSGFNPQRANQFVGLFKASGNIPGATEAGGTTTAGEGLGEWLDIADLTNNEIGVIRSGMTEAIRNPDKSAIRDGAFFVAVRSAQGVWYALVGGGAVFPVDLVQTGGAQGTATAAASWTYSVFDARERGTGPSPLATNYDPTTSGQWVRHIGQMSTANFGFAWYNTSGALEVGWVNEWIITGPCDVGPTNP